MENIKDQMSKKTDDKHSEAKHKYETYMPWYRKFFYKIGSFLTLIFGISQ